MEVSGASELREVMLVSPSACIAGEPSRNVEVPHEQTIPSTLEVFFICRTSAVGSKGPGRHRKVFVTHLETLVL